jgi:hypothetical protein
MHKYIFYTYLYAHVPNYTKNKLPIASMCTTSSPSNTPEPMNAAQFPKVTLYDNVTLQHRSVIIFINDYELDKSIFGRVHSYLLFIRNQLKFGPNLTDL